MPRLDINEKPDSVNMSQATFGKMVAYLSSRGYNPSDIIGHNAGGRSRLEIFEQLREALRDAQRTN